MIRRVLSLSELLESLDYLADDSVPKARGLPECMRERRASERDVCLRAAELLRGMHRIISIILTTNTTEAKMPYTAEEFARCCQLRGLVSRQEARAYCRRHGLTELKESDFEACYREGERPRDDYARAREYLAEPYSPEDMPNSRGRAFEEIMHREQRINDAFERAWREQREEETHNDAGDDQ